MFCFSSFENVSDIILSFHDLLGPSVQPRVDEREIQQHVNEIFDVEMKYWFLRLIFIRYSSESIRCKPNK